MSYGSPTADKVTAEYNIYIEDSALGAGIQVRGVVGEGETVPDAEALVQKIITVLNDHADLTVSGLQVYSSQVEITP